MKNPPPIEIDEAEVERLIDQAQQGLLDAADQKRIVPLLRSLVWLQRTLFETRISLSKLKKILFGKRTEKSGRDPKDPPGGSADGGQESGETPPSDGGLANPPASSTDTPADTPPDAPMASFTRVTAASNVSAAGSIPRALWYACASTGNRWRKSPTTNWSSCAAGRAAPYSRPSCHPKRARRPMR